MNGEGQERRVNSRFERASGTFSAYLLSFLYLGGFSSVVFPSLHVPLISLLVAALSSLDLIVHESGHFLFSFFGSFFGAFGGTILQLIFPSFVLAVAIYRKKILVASLFVFWIGQSLVNISRYIGDARIQALPLFSPGAAFGGGHPVHDWNYLLGKLGLLWADQLISGLIFGLGAVQMLAAVCLPILLASDLLGKLDYGFKRIKS